MGDGGPVTSEVVRAADWRDLGGKHVWGSGPAGMGKTCVTGGVGWEGTGWGGTSTARRSLDRGGGGNGKVLL